MNSALETILAEALEAIESGADLEAVIGRYPAQAGALRGHLSLWRDLGSIPHAEPGALFMAGGREQMFAALSETRPMAPAFLNSTLLRAAAVVAAVVLLAGGAAGASAALGGPDIAGNALDVAGVVDTDGGDGPSENAAERCENANDGRNNANPSSSNGAAHANPRSFGGGDGEPNCVKDDGEGSEASTGPSENANPNALDGCENRNDGRTNASDSAENGDANADPRSLEGGSGDGGQCSEAPGQNSNDPGNNPGGNPDNNAGGNPDDPPPSPQGGPQP